MESKLEFLSTVSSKVDNKIESLFFTSCWRDDVMRGYCYKTISIRYLCLFVVESSILHFFSISHPLFQCV